jgi:hypothetical protein
MDINLLSGVGHSIFLVVAYALIGSGMKYVDQAFDFGVFSKKSAIFMTIPGAILAGMLMAINDSTATIFFAIILGVALTKKIDNIAFQMSLFFLMLVPIFFSEYVKVEWLPFVLLLIAGVADEYTSDWADSTIKQRLYDTARDIKRKITLKQQILEMLFEHRIIMKLIILLLVLSRVFHPIYLIAFLAFDLSYKAVELYSFKLKKYNINRDLKPNNKTTTII